MWGAGRRLSPGQLEKRAASIADPIERLRFLRTHAAAPGASVFERGPSPRTRRFLTSRRRIATALAAIVLIATLIAWPAGNPEVAASEDRVAVPGAVVVPPGGSLPPPPQIWLVDSSETTEVYSNGLRIELAFSAHNRPREPYPVYQLNGSAEPATTAEGPRGIIFHTTESHLIDFEQSANQELKRFGRNLLELLRREGSYHYMIDRFGRVYRVVVESDAANHSGFSVWADSEGLYVDLNDSFLAVAFEAQSGKTGQVTAAQINSARMLTEMLRDRYSIPAENCITHAQVSVNPYNMRIGNHTDWIRDFPFEALGLPDNYSIAPPSLYAFGFSYDEAFLEAAGDTRWPGLETAEDLFRRQAELAETTEARYRAMLQHRYKEIRAVLKQQQMARGIVSP